MSLRINIPGASLKTTGLLSKLLNGKKIEPEVTASLRGLLIEPPISFKTRGLVGPEIETAGVVHKLTKAIKNILTNAESTNPLRSRPKGNI